MEFAAEKEEHVTGGCSTAGVAVHEGGGVM